MKKLKMIIGLFLMTHFVFAQQNFSGIATYKVQKNGKECKKSDGNKKRKRGKKFTLTFNKTESVYEHKVKQKNENKRRTKHSRKALVYKNTEQQKMIAQLKGKKTLLAKSNLKKQDWKLIDETKKIGNYICKKAVLTIGKNSKKQKTITAWYAPDIKSDSGPAKFWGLPGLIMEVTHKKMSIICTDIALNTDKNLSIKAPTEGKEVSMKKLKKIKRKIMKKSKKRRRG